MKSKILLTLALSSLTSLVHASNDCGYLELGGTEYQITDQFKKYVTNSFDAFPKKNDYSQGSIRDYQSLTENNFKILNTGVRTLPSERFLQSYLSSYRFRNIDLDGTAYNLDKSFNIEVITADCKKFYLDTGLTLSDIQYQIKRADDQPISKKDYFDLLGNAIEKKVIGVSSKYDKFEKRVEIKTEYFDKYLIRGYYDPIAKKVDFIQVYTELTFIGDWGQISTSKDIDAQVHKVTRIDSDVDCKSKVLGCVMKETVGVDVSEQFLRKYKKGFELKLMGKQSKVLSINGDVVSAFLEELNQVKTQSY